MNVWFGARPEVRLRRSALALASAVALVASVSAAESPTWRVTRGDVHVLCPMTVGGGFEARTASLVGALVLKGAHPPTFDGDLAVDLKSLDTGIGLRNDHLRDEYLEVGKGEGFDRAVLSNVRLGDVDLDTFQGRTTFVADFQLHGTRMGVKGQAEIRRDGASVRVDAAFDVALADYGIPKPQYLGVGVRNEVQVKVSLVASPTAATSGGSR